jgi:type IV pilus assembly protein PilM
VKGSSLIGSLEYVGQKKETKSFHYLFGRYMPRGWSAAFVPEGADMQWAVIEDTAKGPVLRAHGISNSPEEALKTVQHVASDALYVASVFPSIPTLCRTLQLPPLRLSEMRPAILDLLEQHISSGLESNEVAYEPMPNEDGSWTVTSYLVKQAAIHEHLQNLQSHSIDPEWIIPKAACLSAFIFHFSMKGWHYVIDIGLQETTIVLTFEGKVIEARALAGGDSLFQSSTSEDADQQLRQLLQHLQATIVAYQERYNLDDQVLLSVTGSGTSSHVSSIISDFVRAPLSPLHTLDDTSSLACASAIGAALLARPEFEKKSPPNFRQERNSYPKPMLHMKRPLFLFCAACITLSLLIFWYGTQRSQQIATAMQKDWETITHEAHTNPEEVGKLYDKTTGQVATTPEQILEQGTWLLDQVERRALFPLQPNIPKVTDLIGFLAKEIQEVSTASLQQNGKIEIQNIHYLLVKRPTKAHPKEHYQVRVDLEIASPSVVLARALHERLLIPNAFIDLSASDVKWSSANGKYKASFFLKDRTKYLREAL